jgi:hypothetical protein
VAVFWFLKKMVMVEERKFLRHPILVPNGDFFSFALQRERQSELRANAITIRPDMADDAKSAMGADFFKNAVNDFRVTLHD